MIQFRDLNPDVNAFQRTFVADVKRYDEMERKVRYFHDQIVKANINTDTLSSVAIEAADLTQSSKVIADELEQKFEDLEKELLSISSNQETLDRNLNELIELEHVLDKDAFFFDESDIQRAEQDETKLGGRPDDERSPLVSDPKYPKAINLGFVTGVILSEKLASFEKVLWRATRGNMFLKQAPIPRLVRDPTTGTDVEKNVFIIFFQGARVQAKIKKICESFGANLYPCPDSVQARNELRNQVRARLEDLNVVLARTQEHNKRVLLRVAANLEQWRTFVITEKSIYHTMNLFNYDNGRRCLIAEGWCPAYAIDEVQLALRRATARSGAQVPSILNIVRSTDTPPTYFKTNKFTESFQNIVESYGIARYREINPTVFTIITFPFLFGVMFGDLGHGFFMLLVSLYMCLRENSIKKIKLDEMSQTLFDGRYLVLLMSFFGMYCGFMYNETFAIGMDLFPSQWSYSNPNQTTADYTKRAPYLMGVDPNWKNAENDLYFFNSLKMKMSIVLGVTQMMLGIILSLFNGIHFKKPYNIFFEFIPQTIFLMSTFGYMVVLIFYKWFIDWRGGEAPSTLNGTGPPSILNLMIEMFLSPRMTPLDEYHFYNYQGQIQLVLIILAVVSVPVMLIVKPLLLKRDYDNEQARKILFEAEGGDAHALHEEEESHGGGGHDGHGEEFEFSEIITHQAIHTIEFVLGAISNTASYLRLWALSLAHAELSKVFMEMVLIATLSMTSLGNYQFLIIFVGFAVWAALTVAVLLLMESLSAFLHALRLHWVEFQNKFYGGDGYKFTPFSYSAIMAEADAK
eukprot:TRINITY_DN86_c0_g1_i1.p1 TRINITY_DN86_c0_g1~~TRINITY_DN86_c0_g1_i1.p1  ORF type:complete len:883 (-),score=426.82 TRINITY_DN86_c0_g1_i1:141-2546(-)